MIIYMLLWLDYVVLCENIGKKMILIDWLFKLKLNFYGIFWERYYDVVIILIFLFIRK